MLMPEVRYRESLQIMTDDENPDKFETVDPRTGDVPRQRDRDRNGQSFGVPRSPLLPRAANGKETNHRQCGQEECDRPFGKYSKSKRGIKKIKPPSPFRTAVV